METLFLWLALIGTLVGVPAAGISLYRMAGVMRSRLTDYWKDEDGEVWA